jgi:hypothetical protein
LLFIVVAKWYTYKNANKQVFAESLAAASWIFFKYQINPPHCNPPATPPKNPTPLILQKFTLKLLNSSNLIPPSRLSS